MNDDSENRQISFQYLRKLLWGTWTARLSEKFSRFTELDIVTRHWQIALCSFAFPLKGNEILRSIREKKLNSERDTCIESLKARKFYRFLLPREFLFFRRNVHETRHREILWRSRWQRERRRRVAKYYWMHFKPTLADHGCAPWLTIFRSGISLHSGLVKMAMKSKFSLRIFLVLFTYSWRLARAEQFSGRIEKIRQNFRFSLRFR